MDHTLKLLKQMAHGIAKQFGTSCEVVIHDLNKDLETSIVHIENGQVMLARRDTHEKAATRRRTFRDRTGDLAQKRCQSTR